MPVPRPIALCVVLPALCLLTACRPHHPKPDPPAHLTPATAPTTAPATRPTLVPPALLDIRHGTGSFPLSPDGPLDTPASLAAALHTGYLARLTPNNDDFITIHGPLPDLSLLRVDVSGARMRPDYRPAHFDKKSAHTDRTLAVRRLEYTADPLRYDSAAARISLTADDARLDLVRDSTGARGLVLAGARRGTFRFRAATADLLRILSFVPDHAHGSASHVTVLRSTTLSFTSDDPHTLAATLDVRARWLLLPMTFSLRGRLTANPADGTLTFSDLDATGYDPGGLLAAAALAPALEKMNNQSRPALSFPDPHTHVTDVRFSTANDGLSLTVDFGQ